MKIRWNKSTSIAFVLVMVFMATNSKASVKDNVLSVGPDFNSSEKINFNTLNQNDETDQQVSNSRVLNFKADSIRDTKRKSFHSLRDVEELRDEDVLVIR